jgi:PAS domain S-box-containing protein
MRFNSIRKKIITTVAIVLIVTEIIITSVIVYTTYKQMEAQKIGDIKETANEKSQKIYVYLKNSTDLVEHLASFPELETWLKNPDTENTASALKFLNNFNIGKQYSAIYLLDKNGVAQISTEPTFTGNNYSFRPYFKRAIIGETNMYTAIGATSKAQGFYFASPLKNADNQIIGVVAIKLSPNSLYSLFDNEPKTEEAHIMLTDNYGVILYSDLKDRELFSLGKLKPEVLEEIKTEQKFINTEIKPLQYQGAQDLLNSTGGDTRIYNFFDGDDDESELVSVSPIANYPLFIVQENNSELINASALRVAMVSGIIILLSIFIVLIILSLVIYKNLKPLEKLEGMAKKIGDGDLDIKNEVTSGDELERLGFFFSEMANKIKDYYSDLEDMVDERTKELNSKNDYLNKTKVATLNILEDIRDEKNKTDELAKNLEKFKMALDNASDHIIITDSEGVVLYGNSSIKKITGYTAKESLGKKAGSLWSNPMPKEYYKKMWETIKTDKKTFDGEIKNKKKNGELYDARITISPVLNNKQEVEFFIGIERDITHEKMVDLAKTEFVSLASHQLRTPLSSINWYAEMLLAGDGGKLSDEQETFVKEIYTGNQRMVDLVNALLNVSRLELGTFAVDPEPTDVIKMAQSVISEMQPGITEKKLVVNFDCAKNIPIIQADPKLFRIIFQNLLSNAIKYTPEKGLITLKLSKNTKNLILEVIDTGYGIPKADQAQIFQKLFRAENVREKDTEGTGLGLYIVKSIVDHSGGKISFKSTENKGTNFYLEIPLSGMKKKDGNKKIE